MKGNPIIRRDPCGCIIRSNDVIYCPQHKPVWQAEVEKLIDKATETRAIPNTLSIKGYMHCGKCLDERPDGVSPQEWSELEVGFTDLGVQVWCKRHGVNVMHIDFEGQQHRANTTTAN